MRQDITFTSGDGQCSAWFHIPEGDGPFPAGVMAHGFTALKEMGLLGFAEAFSDAGFAVLTFDYRGFGASSGEIRHEIVPADQRDDYRNAISWMTAHPRVDPERIGIWGTSYSGGHVLHLGAYDRRVKAVVAQAPFVDGVSSLELLVGGAEALAATEAMLGQARSARYQTGEVAYLPVVAPEGEVCALPTPDSYEWFTRLGAECPTWENRVSLTSMELTLEYSPTAHIEHVSPTPLLMIVARDDQVVPAHLATTAFERAGEPKELVVIDGAHFDVYHGDGFTRASTAAVDWFRQHLA
jgi:fermentation-respiration switch protein FrsA (DUF1100 family)